jgi:uncharacterized protein (DUF697 family)
MAVAGDLFKLVRNGLDVRAVQSHIRKPFRFLLCGDPGLVAEMRALLLSGHDDSVPIDAAACLETIIPGQTFASGDRREIRAILSLSRNFQGDDVQKLAALHVPIFEILLDENAPGSGPASPPSAGRAERYVVPALTRDTLRVRLFPHLVAVSKGIEIAVGRRLPVLRETVAAKLTRDAAANALKVALASAVIDHIPVLGLVLGAFASAGDMVAITGIQVMLLLHIEAAYGRDPDVHRVWQILPIIGGGFGWRTIARELAGFIPVAGVPIKGAIAYAGTIVVGEGVTFLHEHGRHMNSAQASEIYDRTKTDALQFARDLISRFGKPN